MPASHVTLTTAFNMNSVTWVVKNQRNANSCVVHTECCGVLLLHCEADFLTLESTDLFMADFLTVWGIDLFVVDFFFFYVTWGWFSCCILCITFKILRMKIYRFYSKTLFQAVAYAVLSAHHKSTRRVFVVLVNVNVKVKICLALPYFVLWARRI